MRLSRAGLTAALLAFVWLLPARAYAADVDAPLRPQLVASQLRGSEQIMDSARGEAAQLRASSLSPADPLGQIRQEMLIDQADYRYRAAARDEQVIVYRIAGDPALSASVLPLVSPSQRPGLTHIEDALRSLWALAGIDDFTQVKVRRSHGYSAPAGLADLSAYYQQAGQRYGVDWTYLAAINYIESDFGRNSNTSSAGAQGPMQFLPSTWAAYGSGNVLDPHDAIFGAARYLVINGAPRNMDLALFRYNNDYDYVDAVQSFAAAIRSDPTWLDRLFYWGTQG